jgi:hypothetical protein
MECSRAHPRRRETDHQLLSGCRADVLRKVNDARKVRRRTIVLDANVLLDKNLSVFLWLHCSRSPPGERVRNFTIITTTPNECVLEIYVAGQSDLIIDYATARHGEEPISVVPQLPRAQPRRHDRVGCAWRLTSSPIMVPSLPKQADLE